MTNYDAIDGLNFSTAKWMHISAKMFRHRRNHPEKPKQHFVIGNAIHTAVLEPELFDSRYKVWDVLTKKKDKVAPRNGGAWDEWLAANPGVQSLLRHEMEHVRACANTVLSDPEAGPVFRGGRREEALTWTDPETGLLCKGRVDYIKPRRVSDLKSTTDISQHRFNGAATKFLYDAQLAFYHYGAIYSGKIPEDAPPPEIVAVEKDPPFDVGVFEMSYEDLEEGRRLCVEWMQKILDCEKAGYWPGKVPNRTQLQIRPRYRDDETGGFDELEF